MCTVTCAKGFVFPDGSAIAISHCRDGNWVPSRSHWITVPDCQRKNHLLVTMMFVEQEINYFKHKYSLYK